MKYITLIYTDRSCEADHFKKIYKCIMGLLEIPRIILLLRNNVIFVFSYSKTFLLLIALQFVIKSLLHMLMHNQKIF